MLKTTESKRKKLENAPLMTKAMRDREADAKKRKYPKTMIRVRLQDRITIQATFLSNESVEELYKVVESVVEAQKAFYLYVTPPMRVLKRDEMENTNFHDAGLAPASVVYLGSSIVNESGGSEFVGLADSAVERLEEFPIPQSLGLPVATNQDVEMKDVYKEELERARQEQERLEAEEEEREKRIRARTDDSGAGQGSSSGGGSDGDGGKKIPKWLKLPGGKKL